MAENNAANVAVGQPSVTGAINAAPIGTTLPTDASTALDAAFENLGYISEDGLTNSIATDNQNTVAWGGDVVLKQQTSRDETFTFRAIETNGVVLRQAYGDENVTVTGTSIEIIHNGDDMPYQSYVMNIVMGKTATGTRIKRIVVPMSKITEIGDIVYNNTDPIGYDFTLSALPDENGNTAYEYIEEVADV